MSQELLVILSKRKKMAQANAQVLIDFRRLTEMDKASMKSLCKECFPTTEYPDYWYENLLSDTGGTYAVGAFVRGPQNRMVGMITAEEELLCKLEQQYDIEIKDISSPYATVMYIPIFGVSTTCRRQGIGQTLMAGLVEYVREKTSHKLIYLHVESLNKTAIRFYEKSGFGFIYRDIGYYTDVSIGEEDDGLVYGLLIKEKNEESGYDSW